nr:GPR endopeptidase [Maliibacterium massiliense]
MAIRTDLAMEAHAAVAGGDKGEVPGATYATERLEGDLTLTRVHIKDMRGEQVLGKPIGHYITIESPELIGEDFTLREQAGQVLARELAALLPKEQDDAPALVVGLGNRRVTPDSLGPRVAGKMVVTHHLPHAGMDHEELDLGDVCAMSPGVLGITGIETALVVQGVVQRIKPRCVICIDALASHKTSRVLTTIQLADSGIAPGAGVGNHRNALNEETLGVPVIALGVPMVVYAMTIAQDALSMLVEGIRVQADRTQARGVLDMLEQMDERDMTALMQQVLSEHMGDLVVTPKEVDEAVARVSQVIADGINLALHPKMDIMSLRRLN